ncbi:NACHT, LRR and PYD domains-containing protein 12-like [Thamnophis elegans]|uniref:NACHT, LRR and PYD domains-containing protein 12-like n=1 Tax=Thamnophis elegans TaxID=35005 RepID=UPI0013771992|nr:NACHT, LRR and PYD domains-containing protein 12-like [Thamnophis elegans]
MNNTVREELYKTLCDLLEKQFKDFKWWLKGIDYNEKPNIVTASLEKANQQEVVDLLIHYYGEDAPKVCIRVLQKSNINDVARKLEETLQKDVDAHQLPDSSDHGSSNYSPRASYDPLKPLIQPMQDHEAAPSTSLNPPTGPHHSAMFRTDLCEQELEDYRSYVKTQFETIEDPNSDPGERVSLDKRYSTLTILRGQLSQQERVNGIQAIGRKHTEIQAISKRPESSAKIKTLFDPIHGLNPKTVVLQGAAGIGKTMMAKKIMLDWASQQFYPDRFNCVFYISCREFNCHAESEKSSIAEIISKQWPRCHAVENFIQNILKNERKLLFIIDGFDELRYSFDEAEDSCCSDPWKKEPIKIILRSLFQKKLLPESFLIITTRPIALKKLNRYLEYPHFFQILGFSGEKMEEYFQNFFGDDKDQATQALRFVQQNDTLFTMCVIPLVSWIICTVLKQEMEGGINLQKMPCTLTEIYMLYLSSLLKYHHKESEQDVQRKLKNVCSLAAEGIWKQQILFTEEEVMKDNLVQDDFFPLFLNENNFKRDIHCIKNFSFIHLSFQEFFASLFYVLKGGEQHHSENLNTNLRALLKRQTFEDPSTKCEYFRSEFAVEFRFLFGFLNEENRMRELKKEFGWEISCENKELLLNWVKKNINSKINAIDLNWITQDKHMLYLYNSFHIKIHLYLEKEILSYLYETQDENFVRDALCAITEINYQCNSYMELMILTYCIQHCQNLEYLYVRSPTSIYQADNGLFLPKNKVHSHRDWKPFKLDEGYMEDFFKSLTKLRNLRVLRLENLHVTVSCRLQLVEVFRKNQKLKELNFIFEDTNHSAVELLCSALQRPCEIETLELNVKGMTQKCSMDLADIFWRNQKLKELKLYLYNIDDKTAHMMFWGLLHRNCKVEKLWLSTELTESCSWRVAELFRKSQTIKQVWLVLSYSNEQRFKMICEALQDRHCKVEELWLFGKWLTDLAAGILQEYS